MHVAEVIIAALAGALMGSFVTVVAHRVPEGESIVTPRSRCPACGTQIAAYDNVPVFSWVLLRGRARCCGVSISARYPATELCLAVIYGGLAIRYRGEPGELILALVLAATLAAVTLTDLERRIIPNRVLAAAAILGIAITVGSDPGSLPERGISALGAGGVLFAAALAYPKGMGLGDVKLAAVMGLFLGIAVIPAMLMALAAGSLVGVAIIVREGASARKRAIPFGPFLALGGIVALFTGQGLIDWYLGTFG